MRKLCIVCFAALECAGVFAQNKADAVASGVGTVRSGVGSVLSGAADAVDPTAPNMLSREMKEEKFFDQPVAFQTNLLHLAPFGIRQCLDVLLKPCPHGVYSTITTEIMCRLQK